MKIGATLIAIVTLGVCLACHFLTLESFPAIFVDEALTASRVDSFLSDGLSYGDLEAPLIGLIDGFVPAKLDPQTAIYSIPSLISGEVSLFGLRLVNLFFGALLLIAVFFCARAIDGSYFGIIALLVTAQSLSFAVASHMARADIFVAALGFVALALHLNNKDRDPIRDLIAGLIIGIGFHIHPRICIYAPVIALLFLIDKPKRLIFRRDFWSYCLGGVLGLGAIKALGLGSQNLSELQIKYSNLLLESRLPPIFNFDFQKLINTPIEIFSTHYQTLPFISALLIIEILLCLIKRDRASKLVFTATIAGLLSTSLLVNQIIYVNIIIVSPFLSLALAHLIKRVFFDLNNSIYEFATKIVISFLVLGMAYLNITKILYSESVCKAEEAQIESWLKSLISADEKIMGPDTYWFYWPEGNYTSWKNVPLNTRLFPDKSLLDSFSDFKPDIYILNDVNAYFLNDKTGGGKWYNWLRVPRKEFFELINNKAQVVSRLDLECNRNTIVYRMNWD